MRDVRIQTTHKSVSRRREIPSFLQYRRREIPVLHVPILPAPAAERGKYRVMVWAETFAMHLEEEKKKNSSY